MEKYFESLLNNNDSKKHTDSRIKPAEIDLPIAFCNFTHTEVRFAISKLRCGKATGMDTPIAPEALKYGGDMMVENLTSICNKVLNGQNLPTQWVTNIIVPIPNKGS